MSYGVSVAGKWAYRSYHLTRLINGIFGQGHLTFTTPSTTTLGRGTLDMGGRLGARNSTGRFARRTRARRSPSRSRDTGGPAPRPRAGSTIKMRSWGTSGRAGSNQVPSVGRYSLSGAKPHTVGPAGVTASFIAVSNPEGWPSRPRRIRRYDQAAGCSLSFAARSDCSPAGVAPV